MSERSSRKHLIQRLQNDLLLFVGEPPKPVDQLHFVNRAQLVEHNKTSFSLKITDDAGRINNV